MSYCRFSDDDFQSDVYCYDSDMGGFVTHVARNRVCLASEELPAKVPFDKEHLNEWLHRHNQVIKLVRAAHKAPIGLAHDGQTFLDDTLDALKERLYALAAVGYRVPAAVFTRIAVERGEYVGS